MCTLIALWRLVEGYDVVVGMNRDESAMRPADPPAFLNGDPPIVAPRDRRAGGTWIGASGYGLVLALANRRGRTSETARSRGLLLLDALRSPDVRSVEVLLQRETESQEYNFWNLMAASRQELRFFSYDGRITGTRGHEGLNVLTNEGANEPGDPRVEAVRGLLADANLRSIEGAVRILQSTLRTHGGPGTASLCVHGTGGGTVSSTILALSQASPEENVLLYADGPPCSTPYRDYREAIRRLTLPG